MQGVLEALVDDLIRNQADVRPEWFQRVRLCTESLEHVHLGRAAFASRKRRNEP